MPKLSDMQLVILNNACQREDRLALPLPKSLKGGAAAKVVKSLIAKGLLEEVDAKLGEPVWRENGDGHGVTLAAPDAAFEALGIETGAEAKLETSKRTESAKPSKKSRATTKKPQKKQAKPRKGGKSKAEKKAPRAARADSKQAQLIAMLKRAKGASIDEIVEAFDWRPHTVRGAIAGALKKKLGLDVTSEKTEGRGRVYRIEA
jgi:hypothetical protein